MKTTVSLTVSLLLSTSYLSAVDYNQDVRPILSQNCFACHGPDPHDRKAKLRLDTQEGAFKSLKGNPPAIVPGKPDESEFIFRINDDSDPMPPEKSHKKLTAKEKKILTQWIAEGAVYSKPWAYVPPVRHPAPKVKDTQWPKNEIDHFLLAHLEKANLQPVKDANPITLIRRLYFDLTGLPPTLEEVQNFVSGKTSYEQVVDHLLQSRHFGERMAVYWLDLVRYADTVGYHGDQDHSISPYRDYIIRAFNLNIPFDQFTREQLAGDLVPDSGKWQKVASGYNRLLQTSHEGGIQAKEYNAIYAADRVRNLSSVWMGATIGCSQCHDHKFDPFTIKDHYSLASFFADIPDSGFSGNSLPTKRPPEITFLTDEQEQHIEDLKQNQKKLLGEEVFTKVAALKNEKQILPLIPQEKQAKWKTLYQGVLNIQKQARRTMITQASAKPRIMRVLPRGNWLDDSGPIVTPAIPEYFGNLKTVDQRRANRLDLANWLTNTENGVGGLTARVYANRLWYLFFGKGLSPSLQDFGGQGSPPTHPKLLDYLSVYFYENNWDTKSIIKHIVQSRAYQLSSVATKDALQKDPENELFSRQNRYRLPAEFIRDNALSISGLIQHAANGSSSVKPYQPVGYYRHLNFPTRKYRHSSNIQQYQRGVYVHWQRMFLHPMLKAMDAPTREECTAQRPRSNTPVSALVLLNDPTFLEAARVFAQRITQSTYTSPQDRLQFACQLALNRNPNPQEKEALLALLNTTSGIYEQNPDSAKDFIKNTGQAHVPADIDPIELASWTAITRAILNLSETNTRN